jgi:hypothetical protein
MCEKLTSSKYLLSFINSAKVSCILVDNTDLTLTDINAYDARSNHYYC